MATEKRLIDANETEKALQTIIDKILRWRENKVNIKDVTIRADEVYKLDNWLGCYAESLEIIQNAPTVDAVEVVHGRWEYNAPTITLNAHWECSACKKVFWQHLLETYKFNYCPNCGAKMDGDVNGTA